MNTTNGFTTLGQYLAERNYCEFLGALEAAFGSLPEQAHEPLRTIGGKGLVLYLSDEKQLTPATTDRFLRLIGKGFVALTEQAIERLSQRICDLTSPRLNNDDSSSDTIPVRLPSQTTVPVSDASTIIRFRRVVRVSDYQWGTQSVSDALGLRISVFRSMQERFFLRALSLRFPGLVALPNYPLDQVADFSKLRKYLDDETIRFGKACRLDALLIVPDEGDSVAAFEVDSKYHDNPEVKRKDKLKDRLLEVLGVPLFRLRADDGNCLDTDDWYALLTDEVLPKINCGTRIRSRRLNSTLIPVT